MTMPSLELTIEYDDPETARNILSALEPDNGTHVTSEIDGSTVIFRMEADNAGTLRNTADDLMACVKIAEEASGLVPGTVTDLDGDTFLE